MKMTVLSLIVIITPANEHIIFIIVYVDTETISNCL